MVNAELLTFISSVFSRLHGQPLLFGGVHVICIGDLMQLPPTSGRQVFFSPVWPSFTPLFLRRSQRHAEDPTFATILDSIRFGKHYKIVFRNIPEKKQPSQQPS